MIRLSNVIGWIAGALLLNACQQPGQIMFDSSSTNKLNDTNISDVANPTSPVLLGSGAVCNGFFQSTNSQYIDSQEDIFRQGISGNLHIEAGKNIVINSMSGNLKIMSAKQVSLERMSGVTEVNALSIQSLTAISGTLCARASAVGEIRTVSGNSHIIAESIESINLQSGIVHIYGAVVKNVTGSSGGICLHDGAKILNAESVSGLINSSCMY